MVYKLGQRVRPKFQAAKIVSLGLLGSLLVGTLATAYADSRSVHLPTYPIPKGKHSTTSNSPSNKTSKSASSVGSAHKAAAAQEPPNAGLPALAALRTADCTLFPPKNPGLASALSPGLRKLAQYEQLC